MLVNMEEVLVYSLMGCNGARQIAFKQNHSFATDTALVTACTLWVYSQYGSMIGTRPVLPQCFGDRLGFRVLVAHIASLCSDLGVQFIRGILRGGARLGDQVRSAHCD